VTQAYATPRAFLSGESAAMAVASGWAWPLGARAFAAIDLSTREGPARKRIRTIARKGYEANAHNLPGDFRAAVDERLAAMSAARADFGGVAFDQARILGILNVTPDSFSDGGAHIDSASAIAHGIAMAEAGADIIDVGGESTRPGAAPVDPAEEADRVLPVVTALAQRGLCVSIDTRHAAVMVAAIAAGARIVNDVTALTGDPAALAAAARTQAAVILMHMQGEPRTMQANPTYAWAPGDVYDWLAARVAACIAAGIPKERIAVDPGIGFGKTAAHSAEVLDHIAMFHGLGCAVAIGASRKSFIAALSDRAPVDRRLGGSLAVAQLAAGQGVQLIRVHDVAETRQALAVAAAVTRG
jgi:dihydropteroate synthase